MEKITHQLLAKASSLAYIRNPRLKGFIAKRIVNNKQEVVVFRNKHDIIIAFEGTDDIGDIKRDIDLGSHKGIFGKVDEGFYQAMNQVRFLLDDYLSKHCTTQRVHMTGHSLGGAVACLYSMYANFEYEWPFRVVTFGCPRVGGKEFQHKFTVINGLHCTQYSNELDWVPNLPWFTRHAYKLTYITKDCKLTSRKPWSMWLFIRKVQGAFDHKMEEYYDKMKKMGL
jgi:predicted lipase